MTIRFCGATRTVTGSSFLVRTPECQFLVDCGLFQGPKTLKELNYMPFPFNAASLDFVLLTHGHIDHAGQVPRLWKAGFRGPVYMTPGTRDLLSFMLPDSGHIQEFEVEALNRRNAKRGKPQVSPIYTQKDAEACQESFRSVDYATWIDTGWSVRARFWNAGHILGSASIEIEVSTGQSNPRMLRLLFSGDLGPQHKLFQPDPNAPSDFDYIVCESTYGGRQRPVVTPDARRTMMAQLIRDGLKDDGILLMPLFAVERTQEVIADLTHLQRAGAIPDVPIFLDSPLAIKITRVFEQHASELEELSAAPSLLANPNLRFTETADESKAIDHVKSGAIILAASGMCEAGRIRHHLKRWLWSPHATVLLAGYQAIGTLGRLLADGAQAVTIQGDAIQVRARIVQTDIYSGHADGAELREWILRRQPIKSGLFLVHGEAEEMTSLRQDLLAAGFPEAHVFMPLLDDEVELLDAAPRSTRKLVPRRLQPEQVGHLDWHNDLAQLILDVRAQFERAADDRSRGVLIRRLRRALDNGPGG